MRIGIFGGSFNPVHNTHKNIGLMLINEGYLDKIIYVPTGDKYNKLDLVSFKHRLEMLKLMISIDNRLDVSDIGNDDRYQYVYQVLDYFNNGVDELYFICGTDNLLEFNTWMKYRYVLEHYKLLVIKRNNNDIDNILKLYDNYLDRIIILDNIDSELSSSFIRNNIDGDIYRYLDDDVYKYIVSNGLYKSRKM